MGTEDEVWEGSQFSERCWDSNYHNADHNEVFHSGYTVDDNTSPLSFNVTLVACTRSQYHIADCMGSRWRQGKSE